MCGPLRKASLKRMITDLLRLACSDEAAVAGAASGCAAASSHTFLPGHRGPLSWLPDPRKSSFKLLRPDLWRLWRLFLPCLSFSASASPCAFASAARASRSGSSRRPPRRNLAFQPLDDGRCSLCRSWSVRSRPALLPGCICSRLEGVLSCCSRLEGPCDEPFELTGSSTADWNALSEGVSACSTSKGEASGAGMASSLAGAVAAVTGFGGGAAASGVMKGEACGAAVNGDTAGATTGALACAVAGLEKGEAGGACMKGDAGEAVCAPCAAPDTPGSSFVASRNLAATTSSGVVGDEAAAAPCGSLNRFAHPRKLACCDAGLGFGLGALAGAAVAAAGVGAGPAGGPAAAGNLRGLPTGSCAADGRTKTKLDSREAPRKDASVAGELDREEAAVAVPAAAGSPAAKRSRRRRSAAAAAAAAAESPPTELPPASDAEAADAVSELWWRLDAARPHTLCAGSADGCCGRCVGIGIATALLAVNASGGCAGGRCSAAATGCRARDAGGSGLGGGGLERACGSVENTGGLGCGGVRGCGTSDWPSCNGEASAWTSFCPACSPQ